MRRLLPALAILLATVTGAPLAAGYPGASPDRAVRQTALHFLQDGFAGRAAACELMDSTAQAQTVAQTRQELELFGGQAPAQAAAATPDCAHAVTAAAQFDRVLPGTAALTAALPRLVAHAPLRLHGATATVSGQSIRVGTKNAGTTMSFSTLVLLNEHGRWLVHRIVASS